VLTVEDHSITGGFGTTVLETANRLGLPSESIVRLGLAPEKFYAHGSRAGQLAEAGIDAAGIAAAVRRAVRAARDGELIDGGGVAERARLAAGRATGIGDDARTAEPRRTGGTS
jgi:1-deoxy-D-xylulose-5-phosphate synthase